jgi:hypothetical protein
MEYKCIEVKKKGKTIPVKVWTGPASFGNSRHPEFKTTDT